MIAFVDGVRQAMLPVTDSAILRGDGVFEAVRSYGGRLFALDDHLARLSAGAAAVGIALPTGDRIGGWARAAAAEGGDGIVRVVVTRGDSVPRPTGDPRVVVLHHALPFRPSTIRLHPVAAPWHPAGRAWELSGVKTVSYAPNVAAGRVAVAAGSDDALLVADDDTVLEGPTFAVAWVASGVVYAPDLELGILDSITRRHTLTPAADMGVEIRTGRFPLGAVLEADEVLAMSTVKEVTPVVTVGGTHFRPGPVTEALSAALRRHIADSLRPH